MTKAGSPVSDETRSLGFWSAPPRNQPAAVTARAANSSRSGAAAMRAVEADPAARKGRREAARMSAPG